MLSVIMILLILIAILMIVVVLLQPGKGDLSASFGGLSSQFGTMFGMQKTADFMAKFTRGLAIAILVLILVANKFFVGPKIETVRPVTEGAKAPLNNTMQPPPVDALKK